MAKRRRRWEEEELEHEAQRATKPPLAELDSAKRAGVLEELQRGSGNRALQQVVTGQQLQREAAPELSPIRETRPYMRIKGVRGPSQVKGHEGEFELVRDYELEVSSPTDRASGQASGKRQYSDLKVVVRKSSGITSLRRAVVENQVIEEIVIVSPVADGVERVTLKQARVVGVKDLADGTVELRFVFRDVTWDAGSESAGDRWEEAK
jgi:hypothetical protein